MSEISIVIPAYNEESNILDTIKRVRKSLSSHDYEIIVVDDGSKDNTFNAVKKSRLTNVKCYRLNKNSGKGAAFRFGIKKSVGKITVQIDADSQFLPEEIPKILKPFEKDDTDVVLASRFCKGAYIESGSVSFRNRIGNYGASLLTSFACLKRVTDIQAGFKAFKTEHLKKIDFKENRFGYEPEVVILASKMGLKIKEIPITYKKRRKGQSNIKFIQDAINISKTIFRTAFFS